MALRFSVTPKRFTIWGMHLARILAIVVCLGTSIAWWRGRGCDEGFYSTNRLFFPDIDVTSERELQFCWGPRGLRLWIWREDLGSKIGAKSEVSPWVDSRDLRFRSLPYRDGQSWGWPPVTYWNRAGFWLRREHFEWPEKSRHFLLLAAPYWFSITICATLWIGPGLRYLRARADGWVLHRSVDPGDGRLTRQSTRTPTPRRGR